MKCIIDIPEDYYNAIKRIPVEQCSADMLIISQGIPLPKWHGDLIDRGDAKYVFNLLIDYPVYSGKDIEKGLSILKTIIPANNAE